MFKWYYGNMIINITSGSCLNELLSKKIMTKCVPFNEAMCFNHGVDEDILSPNFIIKRAKDLNVSVDAYQNALEPFLVFLKHIDQIDTIDLWFGQDMFCQMNLLTILAILDQLHYLGTININYVDEISLVLIKKYENILTNGFHKLYKHCFLLHEQIKSNIKELDDGVNLYFDYINSDGKLIKYIKSIRHLTNNEIITNVFKKYPHYGLGDIQILDLINKVDQN